MPISHLASLAGSLARVFLARRKRPVPHSRHLDAWLFMRAIVAEIPGDVSVWLCDESGQRHRGVYAIGLMLRNIGDLPIVPSDFVPSAPLTITVDDTAEIVDVHAVAPPDQGECVLKILGKREVQLDIECMNRGDYWEIPLYITGNPMANVSISGRIVGQVEPIDRTADEVKASLSERFTAGALFLLVVGSIPAATAAALVIQKKYGLGTFIHHPDQLPAYLSMPVALGFFTLLPVLLLSRLARYFERRKYPKGFPLYSDLEPPLLENLRGMLATALLGKKQRVSISLFDWGKPVIFPTSRKARRRSVDDWIA